MRDKSEKQSTRSLPVEFVQSKIYLIHGDKVMLDSDLAQLYGVETRILVRNVKRHITRFPKNFMFQLTKEEHQRLTSQTGISNNGRGGRRYPPYMFTEQGVAMLSSVLNSERAIQVNIKIIEAFVRLREVLSTHKDLAHKLEVLEQRYNKQFKVVFDAIRELMEPELPPPQQRMGFQTREDQ